MIQNSEYFLEGGRAGVLLIHGLTGTPNEMRLVGKGLHRAGFTVYGMQLAGHCGDEMDLRQTGWRDWYQSVEAAADRLSQSVDQLFVAGLSMGAVLALKLAAERRDQVAGVGVFGPTFKYDGWSIPAYARYLNFMVTWFQPFNLFQNRVFAEQPPYGLKDERLREVIVKSMLEGDSASAGLAGNPWPSLAEMILMARKVKRQLHRVHAPCLIMHASNDDIAHINNSRLVASKVKGEVDFVELHDSYHMITIDRERKKVIAKSTQFFQSIVDRKSVPQQSVQSRPAQAELRQSYP
jgi:carboxylesterase